MFEKTQKLVYGFAETLAARIEWKNFDSSVGVVGVSDVEKRCRFLVFLLEYKMDLGF